MYLTYTAPAFLSHPVTGEKIWFNQAIHHHCTYSKALPQYKGSDLPDEKYPCHTYYGDGSDIEPEVLQHVRAVSWSCAVGFRWKKGDLIVLDNLNVQHGRMAFTGERKLLVHMTADWTYPSPWVLVWRGIIIDDQVKVVSFLVFRLS